MTISLYHYNNEKVKYEDYKNTEIPNYMYCFKSEYVIPKWMDF